MARRCCTSCVYAICDPEVWLRWQWMGVPLVPQCANHPSLPGRLQDVTGTACCNYRPKPVLPHGESVRLIPLGNDGCYAYVGAADYEWLSRHTWYLNNGYAARCHKGKWVFMHREIMQPPKGMVVDHIDGNRVNDCRFNLRICTRVENQRNLRKRRGSRSKFKGVTYHRQSGKWCAKCWFEGKYYSIGYFDNEIDAARAYDAKAVECFGEFARLNFPEEWPPKRRAEVYAEREAAERRAKARKRKKTAPRQSKSKKATRRTRAAKQRATKQAKTSKRTTQHAKRTTKPERATSHGSRATASKRSRAETPGRGGQKQKAKPARATGRRSQVTAPKHR